MEEAFADLRLLEANLAFLMSPEARSASTFGVLLGRKDTSGNCLEPILSAARETRSSALLRGYVGGLLPLPRGVRWKQPTSPRLWRASAAKRATTNCASTS